MVRELTIVPDFRAGHVRVGGNIPKFRYAASIEEELERGNLSPQKCLDMLECMLFVRNFEQMIAELRGEKRKYGSLKYLYIGATHLCIGQEAVSVGAMAVLGVKDHITSTHRGHGDSLAKGYFAIKDMDEKSLVELIESDRRTQKFLGLGPQDKDRDELVEQALQLHLFRAIAETFGKEEGYCHGRGGSMHISDFSKGHLGANGIVGGSMAIAVGAAMTSRYFGDGSVVFCFAGDGAFNNGIAHEAMNMATMAQFTNGLMKNRRGVPVVFCIVNNQYGMTGQQRGEVSGIEFLAERGFGYNTQGMHAKIVNGTDVLAVMDAARRAARAAREGEGPYLLEFWCTRHKGHSLSDRCEREEDESYRTLHEIEMWRKVDPIDTYAKRLLEAGLVDETQLEVLKRKTRARNEAMAVKGASAADPDSKDISLNLYVNSVSTSVPRRFKPRNLDTKPSSVMRDPEQPITYREAIAEALYEEMSRDSRVVFWGQDICEFGGAFGCAKGLFEVFERDRVFNTPISEAAMIGTGVGASLRGLRPIVEILYIDFMLQAFDQLINQAAKWRYMSGGQAVIPLTVRTSIGGGKGYAGQHSQSLEGLLAHIPGIKIAVPSNAYDVKGLLKMAVRDDNPVVVIEHQVLYDHPRGMSVVPKDDYLIPFGKAIVRRRIDSNRSNRKVTIVAWSAMVSLVMSAAEDLSRKDIEAEVVDLRTIYPLDMETVIDSVKKTGRVLIVHEAVQTMGFGAEVGFRLQDEAFDYLDGPITRLTAPNVPPPASPVLERSFVPDRRKIVGAVEAMF